MDLFLPINGKRIVDSCLASKYLATKTERMRRRDCDREQRRDCEPGE
eukprot:COSAG06_NODE_65518_length_256_cov_18.764331_1_plen_47_part_00